MELNIDKPFSRKNKKKSNDEEGEPPNPISGSKTEVKFVYSDEKIDDEFEQTKFIYDDDKKTKFIYEDEKTEDDEFINDYKKTKFINDDEETVFIYKKPEEDKFIYSDEKTMFKYDDEKTEEDDYNYGYESTEFSYGDEQSKDRLSEQDKKSEDKFVYSSKDSTGVKFDYDDEKPVDEDKFVYNEEKAEGSYLVYNNATSASTVYPNQPRQSRDESYNSTEKSNVQYKSKNKSTFSEQGNIINDSNENLGEKFKNENKSLNKGRLTESTTESIQIKPNLSNEARTGYSDVSSNNEPPLSKSQRKKLNKQKRQADDMQAKGEFVEKREQIDDKQAQGKEVEKREQIDDKQVKGKDVEKRDQTNKQAKVKDVEKRDQTNDKQAKGNV
ncbi:13036_t:CDS:1, partial [Funneliformis caledonium]